MSTAHRLGHAVCWSAATIAVAALGLFLFGRFEVGVVVAGCACVLLVLGSVLLDRPDRSQRCPKRVDRSTGGARCPLLAGHRGSCPR